MEAAVAPENRYYTVDEWLALEEELDTKFEYLDGYLYDIRAMAGGTIPHGRACANVSGAMRSSLRAKRGDCFTYTSEVKIHVERHRRYYYPDASVRCGDEIAGGKTGSYKNPIAIVEVVSKSSHERDTVEKFEHYASLPSLRDYVLVFLRSPTVHVFSRDSPDAPMTIRAYYGLDDVVRVPSVDVTLAMAELYEHVGFPPAAKVVQHPGSGEA